MSRRAAAVDQTTEEGRAFLQQRLALFGRWFFAVALLFYLIANFPLAAIAGWEFDWFYEFLGVKERFQLGLVAVAALLWLATRGQRRTLAQLAAVDAGATLAAGALVGGMLFWQVHAHGQVEDVFSFLLAVTNLVIVRAVVVPSSMRRTLWISAGTLAPPVAATFASAFARYGVPADVATNVSATALLWAFIAVTSATIVSRILFVLRGQVRDIKRLGQYHLGGEIGRGGMGVVYRATHAMLRRPTAIKLLAPDRTSDVDLSRFEREVRLTARLAHPNTVAVYDYGRTPDGVFYYAMELLDGITLAELIALDGAQPAARVIHILRQMCGALAEAHAVGLIHRDVKPANLMIGVQGGVGDVVKVLDFGLVKRVAPEDGDPDLSNAGSVVGTPHYLAPESIEAPEQADARADLYAAGAVAYFLLTGQNVFEARTPVLVCSKHLVEEPVPPSQRLGKPVPADLEALVLRCLAKAPADRPQTAAALEQALAGCADAGRWSAAQADGWWLEFNRRTGERRRPRLGGPATIDVDLVRTN